MLNKANMRPVKILDEEEEVLMRRERGGRNLPREGLCK